jgi:hypothetical protein
MLPFCKFSANATDRLVALRLVPRRTGRFDVAEHLRAATWLSREALIFEPEPCTSWCRLRVLRLSLR